MNIKYKLFYELALNLAKISYINDEVPVGAVIIKDETYELVSWSYNQMKANKSSLDHAEMLALKDAMKRLQEDEAQKLINEEEIKSKAIASMEQNGIVFIDEAYIDYSNNSLISKLKMYQNLIISQTFSKALGLAGIRLGVGYSNSNLISYLKKVKPPYNVNS